MSNPLKLFISHSSKDDSFGRKLVADLTQQFGTRGEIWYDTAGGLKPGDSWWSTIISRIQDCTHFLVILSPDAMDSRWVNDEMTMAWQQRVERALNIIPIHYQDCTVRNDYRTIQMIDFLDQDYDDALAQLTQLLQKPVAPMQYTQIYIPSVHPHTPQAHPRLLIMPIIGERRLQTIFVSQPILTIGREVDNDVVLEDTAVSGHHIYLTYASQAWQVHCQTNARFFYVNGHPSANALLRDGDQIIVGATIIRFEIPVRSETNDILHPAQIPTMWSTSFEPRFLVECSQARFSAPLREETITVGRDPSCGLAIPEQIVSHYQAQLQRDANGHYVIQPQAATNPLTYKGQIVNVPRLLIEGDVFTIGASLPNHTVLLRYTARPSGIMGSH